MKYIDNTDSIEKPVKIGDDCLILKGVKIGSYSYLGRNCVVDKGAEIGKFCSIGINCYFNPGSHPTDWLSTHPFQYTDAHFGKNDQSYKSIKKRKFLNKQNCKIGNDVYIGSGVTVLKGVNIGNGAIIGANSTVTKDIPPYAIAVGSPAKVINYRFQPHIIENLLNIKWWDLPLDVLSDVEFDNIELAVEQLCKKTGIKPIRKNKKQGIYQKLIDRFIKKK